MFAHRLIHLLLLARFCFGATNNILFERIETRIMNPEVMSYFVFEMKPIAPNVYRMNATVITTRPLQTFWVRYVLYRKSTTYTKYLIDLWEDACAFLGPSYMAPLSKIVLDNFMANGLHFNFPLRCPLNGSMSIIHDRINISHLVTPLVAAGRYRLDMTTAEGKGRNLIAFAQIYGSVSDLRVWF